ncbi:putative membrane protein YccC [Luteibacter rhizovicinus]|uniref:Putative membrane protein YccC n=1 Tax=Luteibacter rhizovicinus TaxID=242606 RepID=A0A4R3YTH1_9GAMM|nr:FUSC family protein [Luteibacter rhizovicinus]TCV96237.1 putative membrane protein YccC [Luteibacter rhizovicinus]
MSAIDIEKQAPATRQIVVDTLREQVSIWLFVFKTMLAFFLTGWIAMRLSLPAPSTAMLTTIIVANRQSGMVLAKSFYRAIGTLGGAVVAFLIVAAFPQQRDLFLVALSLWLGICSGGATLYRNFKSYAFVLGGYTAAIIALPVIDNPPGVFDSATARISEVLLGLLVSGVINDTVFPSRMRDVLRRTAREQFAHFVGFVRASTGGTIARSTMERAHLRFVRDAVTLEDLRSSVIFEDAEARARSGHLQEFNQRFMAASTSFQSLHHLINRLKRAHRDTTGEALIALYAPLGAALDAPIEAGAAARVLLPRLIGARDEMAAKAPLLREGMTDTQDVRDFDTGAALLRRFTDELYAYVDTAATLQAPRIIAGSAERVRFARGNDYAGAILATFRTTITMLALGVFWILSAWPMGSSAMLLATIFAGLFAAAPNPTRVTGQVMFGYLIGMIIGFVCEFAVLTQVDGYPLMVASIAPFLMIGLVMMTSATLGSIGLGYSMGFAYILAIKNPMVYDPVHFINDAIAQVVGLSAAAIAFVFVPTVIGSRWLRQRQLARLRGQVALAAEAPLPGLRHRFESINHDLVSQVVSQTEPGSADSRALLAWALAVHETGRALIELRHDLDRGTAPGGVRGYIDTALASLARFYEAPDAAKYLLARDAVATAIAAVSEKDASHGLLEHLHLIRMALLDGESVLAAYMPSAPLAQEISNAP